MKTTTLAAALGVALGAAALVGTAYARNPHCAGGIQYVVQGLRDKEKGNLEDYQRQMLKAVQQLEICASEDPEDYEAIGYLGWAYAEIDSAGPAGVAFKKAIDGLTAKGDKRKAETASVNRDSYWATAFNNGITMIKAAQDAYPNFTKPTENESDVTLKEEARKKYLQALTSLTHALQLKPEDPRTLRNLGSAHAFMGEWEQAEAYFEQGLKAAPADTDLVQSLHSVRQGKAGTLIDEKKYDEAVAYYEQLIQADASNPDLYLGLAEAHFKKAQSLPNESRKPEYKLAGDAYAKAAGLKSGAADLAFNAGLSYTNASEPALAEPQWRAALNARPDDADAMSALGSTLADLKKFDEAVQVLHQAVDSDPKNKTFHRQLGAVYTKAGNNAKATEELMIYLALHNGTPAADPAAEAQKAPASSAAGKAAAAMGAPDQVSSWEADGKQYATWFYWSKRLAIHFDASGAELRRSDWSAAASKTAGKK